MSIVEQSIKKIVLYGVGLLGGSLGASFKQSGFSGVVVGVSSERSIKAAQEAHAIDLGYSYDEAQEALVDADLLIICSPINAIKKTLHTIAKLELPNNLLISDVGSTKEEIIAVAEEVLPKNVIFIGGHPMAGSEKSGASEADPFLFQNAVYVLSPAKEVSPVLVADFGTFLTIHLGCRVVELDSAIHDKIASTVSHVPHIVAVAMVNVATKIDSEIAGTLDLAAGGFKSLTRIASSPYGMWHDIYDTNKRATTEVLDKFIDELQTMRRDLQEVKLKASFDSAVEGRKRLSGGRKGFIGELHQIVVVAEDKRGFLAQMTALLSNNDINIRDIELLKIREGEAGTFMLAFESLDIAESAVELLNQHNFIARSR